MKNKKHKNRKKYSALLRPFNSNLVIFYQHLFIIEIIVNLIQILNRSYSFKFAYYSYTKIDN